MYCVHFMILGEQPEVLVMNEISHLPLVCLWFLLGLHFRMIKSGTQMWKVKILYMSHWPSWWQQLLYERCMCRIYDWSVCGRAHVCLQCTDIVLTHPLLHAGLSDLRVLPLVNIGVWLVCLELIIMHCLVLADTPTCLTESFLVSSASAHVYASTNLSNYTSATLLLHTLSRSVSFRCHLCDVLLLHVFFLSAPSLISLPFLLVLSLLLFLPSLLFFCHCFLC